MDEQKKIVTLHKNEIDFVDLGEKLWQERKIIFIGLCCGAILGLVIAFTTPKSYKVVTTMLPQDESNNSMGKLSSLASLAGFDMDLSSSESDISPVIYPQIVNSAPFLLDLMKTPFTYSKVNHKISMYEYATKYENPGIFGILTKYTIGLPALIIKSLKNENPISKNEKNDGLTHMNEDEMNISLYLQNNLSITINKKEGYLTLTCTFSEALLTAQVAKRAQDLLQQTITEYKTKKATEELNFFEKRYAEKKRDYEIAQEKLASYKDRNLFVITASASAESERLQNDYNLSFAVYSELAKQLENAKIKVKKSTPVFAILKPVVVPLEPSKPKKTMILIVYTIIGGCLGCCLVFGKKYIVFLKKNKKMEKTLV
jgi:uncharacterized protein involved in exopolysaccharide biosynthesis